MSRFKSKRKVGNGRRICAKKKRCCVGRLSPPGGRDDAYGHLPHNGRANGVTADGRSRNRVSDILRQRTGER